MKSTILTQLHIQLDKAVASDDTSHTDEVMAITDEQIAQLESGMIGCRCYALLSRLKIAESQLNKLKKQTDTIY